MSLRFAFAARRNLLRQDASAEPVTNVLAAFWSRTFRVRERSDLLTSEVIADARAFLGTHRAQMDEWFFTVRMTLGLGLTGYLLLDATLTAQIMPAGLLLVAAYLGLNLGVWGFAGSPLPPARWLYAGLDLVFVLLLRYVFLFEALVDPNATMVGACTLLLISYVSYSDPRLIGTAALVVLGITSVTLSLDTLHLVPPRPSTLAYRLHPLRAFLLLSYLGAVCLVTYALALRLRKQVLAYSVELQKRTQAALDTALERARGDKLQELNHLKRDFISMLSHELRTPLTPLRTSLEIVRSEMPGEPGSMEMVNIALDAAGRLQRLVQDYTHLAELLTQGGAQRDAYNLQLDELVGVLLESVDETRFVCEGLREQAVSADPRLLAGALLALMRRAELLTPPGGTPITVRGRAADDCVVVVIHDPTSYIEEDTLSLDDPFSLSSERTYFSSNTGLELILAQYSLRRMGGNLRVESSEEGGTTVHCTLPGARKNLPWAGTAQLRLELESFGVLQA